MEESSLLHVKVMRLCLGRSEVFRRASFQGQRSHTGQRTKGRGCRRAWLWGGLKGRTCVNAQRFLQIHFHPEEGGRVCGDLSKKVGAFPEQLGVVFSLITSKAAPGPHGRGSRSETCPRSHEAALGPRHPVPGSVAGTTFQPRSRFCVTVLFGT